MYNKEQEEFIEEHRSILISCCNKVLDTQLNIIDEASLVGTENPSIEDIESFEGICRQVEDIEVIRRKITKKEKLTTLEYSMALVVVITATYSMEIHIEQLQEAFKKLLEFSEKMRECGKIEEKD